MISDEDLKRAAGADVGMALTQFCRESGLLKAGLQAQEMATDLLLYRQFQNTPCRWGQDMDGNWQTGCDNVFIIEAGGPEENGMRFCPYCGHHLEEMA